jgi:transporter family protein
MWIVLAACSSVLLGIYDILKKGSLRNNAFIPVLFFATLSGAVIFIFLVTFSKVGILAENSLFFVPEVAPREHLFYFFKACLVGMSWYFGYMALSNLPLTIVVPIRSTAPIWTVAGAFFLFNERFNVLQWTGIVLAIVSTYLFALAGKKEGISFRRNKWIYAIVFATILGSISSLYDKYLLERYNRLAVQSWFSIYMVLVMLPILLIVWFPKRKIGPIFEWRWLIPCIGIVLSLADFLYFYALSYPDALLGVISIFRRGSVVISFSLGALIFREGNIRAKSIGLIGIIISGILLIIGSQ